MSPGEMRVLLLILGSLTADSTPDDPCVNHTVLDQPWRSSDCHRTRCSGRWMDDGNLNEGWYRFSSSDNVTIPESAVSFHHCSAWSPGWLNGLHPSVEDGEVTGKVCFTWIKDNSNGDPCRKHQEIRIKNCDGYIVYLLKPTPGYYSVYCADSARSDPCVIHTVLDQPWRSTDCPNTQCINGQWKSDQDLAEGWYRFNSSGGWKIPETVVPAHHCSGKNSGWLKGSHPNVREGEVTRRICFKKAGNAGSGEAGAENAGSGEAGAEDKCSNKLDIKVKNCSSYFVYQLKPTPRGDTVYCTAADSALGDPCVNHTVLDQPWRSTGCTSGDGKHGDENHRVGWYRFKSSGGWKIPETVVSTYHCSGTSPGWLNGSHPIKGDGEVTRTVCFTWDGNPCETQHEIKVKHCGGFFVYRLEPTLCCNKVYCTDPASVSTEEPQETTPEPREDLSTVPEPDTSSDPPSGTTQEPQGATSGDSSQGLTSDPAGSASSDPKISTGEQTQGSSTGESTQEPSSVPVGDTSSGPQSAGGEEHKESTTGEPSGTPSAAPERETCSAPWLLTEEECERLISEAQVLFVGDQDLGSTKDREAHLQQLREVLRKQLPCAQVKTKGPQTGKRQKWGRN